MLFEVTPSLCAYCPVSSEARDGQHWAVLDEQSLGVRHHLPGQLAQRLVVGLDEDDVRLRGITRCRRRGRRAREHHSGPDDRQPQQPAERQPLVDVSMHVPTQRPHGPLPGCRKSTPDQTPITQRV